MLLAKDIGFPLTHDIEERIELAEASGLHLPEAVCGAGLLSPYAVATRYPGSCIGITASDVDEAPRTAAQAISWAKGILVRSQGEDQ